MEFFKEYIDGDLLRKLSICTNLKYNLKHSIGRFDESTLLSDVNRVLDLYSECEFLDSIDSRIYYRIKSYDSCRRKYLKYYPNWEVEKVFNDLLGLRIIIPSYDTYVFNCIYNNFSVVDMRQGKKRDDGYRGVHIYYQVDHKHYPIEIQINTSEDIIFHNWLHKYVYKYYDDISIGQQLRSLYECGMIENESTFKEAMENVLSVSKKV